VCVLSSLCSPWLLRYPLAGPEVPVRANSFEPIAIEIDNQNFSDLTVYLIWNADRRRLGSVGGKRSATFRSNWYGPILQVEVELLAGARHAGPSFSVSPGDDILVEIPPNIDQQLRVIKRRG